jgi:hypothetical protein
MYKHQKKVLKICYGLGQLLTLVILLLSLHEYLWTKKILSDQGIYCLFYIILSISLFKYLNCAKKEHETPEKNPD